LPPLRLRRCRFDISAHFSRCFQDTCAIEALSFTKELRRLREPLIAGSRSRDGRRFFINMPVAISASAPADIYADDDVTLSPPRRHRDFCQACFL